MVKQNRIIAAVKSMLPESSWPELIRKLDGEAGPAEPLDNQIGALDADDDEYDPLEFAEIDDEDDDF
jgi:hypothetical protein